MYLFKQANVRKTVAVDDDGGFTPEEWARAEREEFELPVNYVLSEAEMEEIEVLEREMEDRMAQPMDYADDVLDIVLVDDLDDLL